MTPPDEDPPGVDTWRGPPNPTGFVFEQPASSQQPRRFARGPMSSFLDVAGVSIEEAWYIENSLARDAALDEVYKRQITQVYEATGVELTHPHRDIPLNEIYPALPFMRAPDELGWGPEAARERHRARFDAQVADLRRRNPDKADRLPQQTGIEQAIALGQDVAARAAEIRGRASGGDALFGSLVGGIIGSLGDPYQVATLPVGFGSRTIVGAAMKEAAVNAGITGGLELMPGKAAWLDELGQERTAEDIMARIGTAAAFGATFGGGGKFLQQGAGLAMFDRTAFEVFRQKYDALPPDHPFRNDTLTRAIEETQRVYTDRDLNPGVDPEEHAANLRQGREHAAAPEATAPPPGVETPDRLELRALLDRRATPDEIWASKIAREVDEASSGAPTLASDRDPIPEGRQYQLPGEDGAPRAAGVDETVAHLTSQARAHAGPEGPLKEKRAIFVVGYPGAGKSTFIQSFARTARAAVADTDEAKLVIPEYQGGRGTQIVNNESSVLRRQVVDQLTDDGDNLIIETLGRNAPAAMAQAEALKSLGYNVEIAHVRVNPGEAVLRQWRRFLETGRSIQPKFMKSIMGKVETGWQELLDSGAFSRYLDIDYSGSRSEATASQVYPRDTAGRGERRGTDADVAGQGRETKDSSEPWDLEEAVRQLAASAGLGRQDAPPPSTPAAAHDAGLDPAIAAVGEDPNPANSAKAAEAVDADVRADIERELQRLKEPRRLRSYLRSRGGMKDPDGELRSLLDVGNKRPDAMVNNKSGEDIENARIAAWEEGYFPGDEPPELNEFLNAIRDDIGDVSPRYRLEDQEIVQRREDLQEMLRDFDRQEELPEPPGPDSGAWDNVPFARGDVPAEGAGATAADIRAAAVEAFGPGADQVFDVANAPTWAPVDAKAATLRDGRVIVFADRLRREEVKGVLLHEIGAHAGGEKIMGKAKFSALLDDVLARASEAGEGDPWRGVLEHVQARYPDADPRALREEVLGRFLDQNPDLAPAQSWWPKLKRAVEKFVARLFGQEVKLTDAEIVELARGAVRARIAEGAAPEGTPADGTGARFARSGAAPSAGGPAPPPPGFGQPKQPSPTAPQPAPGPVTPAEARARFIQAKQRQASNRLTKQMRAFRNGSGQRDIGEFLQAVLDFQGQGTGLTLSVDGLRKVITARSLAEMEAVLHHFRLGTGGRRVNRADVDNFVKEMFGEDSKDAAAKALAKAAGPVFERLRQRFNRAGGQIGKLDNWGLPQQHNPLALRNFIDENGGGAAGRAVLKDRLYKALDASRMRDVHTGKPMSAQEVWNSLDTVIEDMLTDGWATRKPSHAPSGRGMLANQRNEHRFLIFRDAETWLSWQRDFGAGDPVTAMVAHVEGMARDIAAMEILGPNPEASIEWLQQTALHEAAQADLGRPAPFPPRKLKGDATGYVEKKIHRMDEMWANYTGAVNVPLNRPAATGLAVLRNVLTSISLGGAFLSAAPTDPVFQAFARQFAGTSHGQMINQLARQTFKQGGARRAAQMAVILDHNLSVFGEDARFAGQLAGAGWSSVLAQQVLAASALTPWTRGGRQVFGMGFLADLGNEAGKAFADVDPILQRTMQRYGIDALAWDQMRAAPLTPEGLMSPADVNAAAGTQVSDRLLHMILQETEYAVPSGTLRSRSLLTGTNRPGTLWGEIRRSGRMFMSFGATLPMLYGYRFIHQVGHRRAAQGAAYAGGLLLTLTVGGAVSMQLKSLASGKDPDDMTDAGFLAAAALQGGGFGIYGDFLFADANRIDRSLGETLGGPVVGLVGDLKDLTVGNFDQMRKGEDSKAAAELGQFVTQNIPGSSLWYLRLGWDRVMEDNMRRFADPGADEAFRRRVQSLKRNTGQSYWWAPGQAGPARAPDMGAADLGGQSPPQ